MELQRLRHDRLGGETTLDVEWAHAIAPARASCWPRPRRRRPRASTGFPQIVEAENYVDQAPPRRRHQPELRGHRADVRRPRPDQPLPPALGLRGRGRGEGRPHHVLRLRRQRRGRRTSSTARHTTPTAVTSWPDSDPLVTGVGGTELVAGSGGAVHGRWRGTTPTTRTSATAPTRPPAAAACRCFFTRPAYQNGVASVVGGARGVPDVSMNAACSSPVFTYQSFPQAGIRPAGTRPAAPARRRRSSPASWRWPTRSPGTRSASSTRRCTSCRPRRPPASSRSPPGNNTVTFVQDGQTRTIKGFDARAGYSLVDGVGTVNGWYLAYELAGKTPPE